MNRDRFPGLRDGWARLDGAAGSQVVDSVIEAMSDWMRSGSTAFRPKWPKLSSEPPLASPWMRPLNCLRNLVRLGCSMSLYSRASARALAVAVAGRADAAFL